MIKFSALFGGLMRLSQRIFLRLILGLVAFPLPVWAVEPALSKTALQAVYVYNFTQFIEWPAAPANTPFRLCVVKAKREMRKLLNQLNGKTANHQVIELVHLHADFSIARLQSCQLIFQPTSVASALPQPLPRGVVLVAKSPEPNDPNVSIAMQFNRAKQLKFSINQAAVAVAGVKISSQLLKLAIDKPEANKP